MLKSCQHLHTNQRGDDADLDYFGTLKRRAFRQAISHAAFICWTRFVKVEMMKKRIVQGGTYLVYHARLQRVARFAVACKSRIPFGIPLTIIANTWPA